MSTDQVFLDNQQNPIFNKKKILTLVLGYSSISDYTRLARTCRSAFEAATSFVWEHVDGAQHLFKLLSRTFFIFKSPTDKLTLVVSLYFHCTCCVLHWT
jgi:hypothetical protein